MAPRLTVAPTPAQARVAALVTRRRQVQDLRAAELRRRATAAPAAIASLERIMPVLDAELVCDELWFRAGHSRRMLVPLGPQLVA